MHHHADGRCFPRECRRRHRGHVQLARRRPLLGLLLYRKNAAEVISHELGHTLKLSHDGRTTPVEDYYAGHGSDDVGWAPIMGSGYTKNLTQWSKGEYPNADNTEDDLFKITEENNDVDYRADDHGINLGTASYLYIDPQDDSVDSDGVIETRADVDALRFTLTTTTSVTLTAEPIANGPNLDIYAELRDVGGGVLA
jgi:serralysin